MKAWRTYKYNEDVSAAIGALKLETDVPVPSPGAGEVRVKVLGGMFVSIANFTPAPENYTNAKFVNMILKSDGADLKAMVKLFEEGKLKVCVDEHFPFDKVPDALSKSLTARSGGKLVIDVASPAPSESCCVVA